MFDFETPSGRRRATLAAGLFYLGVIAGGIFAEGFVRGSVLVAGDAAATAANILDNEFLYRAGMAVSLVFLCFNLPILLVFYRLLKPTQSAMATLMAFFFLVATSVETANVINHMTALDVLRLGAPLAALPPGADAVLSFAALDRFATGFGVSLVYFGVYFLILGSLLYRSRLLPRALGVLLAIAGICYLVNSFAMFLAPPIASLLFPYILLPCLVAELLTALWLLTKGIDETRWAGP